MSTVLYGLNCSTILSFLLVLSPAYWSLKNDWEGHMQLPGDLPYQTKPTRRREILVHLWKAPGFSFQCELFLWLFFLLDPIWCQNSQPPHRSGFCLIFFTWSQVEPWCDRHCAVPPGIRATQRHFQKTQVTRTTILTRLCRSHCQRKDRSQFPSYGIIKGNGFWVFTASTELWGCERQAALYCHSCSCTKEAVPLFCCRKPYQSDLGFWGPFFLILLISHLDMGGMQGAAYWL